MEAIILDKRGSKPRTKLPFSNKKLSKSHVKALLHDLFNNEEVEESSKDSISDSNYKDNYKGSAVLVNSILVKNSSPADLHNLLSIPNKKAPAIKSKTK